MKLGSSGRACRTPLMGIHCTLDNPSRLSAEVTRVSDIRTYCPLLNSCHRLTQISIVASHQFAYTPKLCKSYPTLFTPS